MQRRGDETAAVDVEQRRRQRIDAASRMVSHLVSVVIWIVATIVAFHLLDIEAAFFLSSAGFLGAAIAIGGQHKVNDYLTGLSVHFEDRYGVGDEIQVEVGWGQPVTAVVDHIGLFSTRLRDARSTLHFPNSALANLRNLSQEAAVSTIRLSVPDDAEPRRGEVAAARAGRHRRAHRRDLRRRPRRRTSRPPARSTSRCARRGRSTIVRRRASRGAPRRCSTDPDVGCPSVVGGAVSWR